MAPPRLPNYVRTNRKRLGLSQGDVAFLLGVQSGAKISRYEQFTRDPSLETVLAFEAIFQRPVRELFPGRYQEIEKQVAARARALTLTTNLKKADQQTARKRQKLTDIADAPAKKSRNQQ